MGRALSHDLRDRVLKASKGGLSARRCAERFGVAASTAIRWIDRAAKGETKPRKPARRASRLDAHEAFIDAMIEERKDITLDEMVVCLADECAVKIGRSALSAWLRSRGWTFKTYGPPRWQVGCVRLCSVVHKRIRRSGTLALAMMEIRASWSS